MPDLPKIYILSHLREHDYNHDGLLVAPLNFETHWGFKYEWMNLSLILTKICHVFLSASRIRYEITKGNTGGAFAVKNMTGAIYVAGPLDYETRKRVCWILLFLIQIFSEYSKESWFSPSKMDSGSRFLSRVWNNKAWGKHQSWTELVYTHVFAK